MALADLRHTLGASENYARSPQIAERLRAEIRQRAAAQETTRVL